MASMVTAGMKLYAANQADMAATASELAGPSLPVGFTPGGLLAYCASRMNAIDTTINKYFADQQAASNNMQDATKLMEVLRQFPNGMADKDHIDTKFHAKMGNDLIDVYNHTTDPDLKAACAKAFRLSTGRDIDEFAKKSGGIQFGDIDKSKTGPNCDGAGMDKATWDAQIDNVKDHQGDLSKSSELNMIQLQSLVSQRQLAVQLTTQLMQQQSEAPKMIVGNIK